jgi:hypothetical protein
MDNWRKYLTVVFACGAAAVAVAAAPAAAANAQQGPPNPDTCASSATSTKCLKQGDAEINAATRRAVSGRLRHLWPVLGGLDIPYRPIVLTCAILLLLQGGRIRPQNPRKLLARGVIVPAVFPRSWGSWMIVPTAR